VTYTVSGRTYNRLVDALRAAVPETAPWWLLTDPIGAEWRWLLTEPDGIRGQILWRRPGSFTDALGAEIEAALARASKPST
jgi:hypothetical protein